MRRSEESKYDWHNGVDDYPGNHRVLAAAFENEQLLRRRSETNDEKKLLTDEEYTAAAFENE